MEDSAQAPRKRQRSTTLVTVRAPEIILTWDNVWRRNVWSAHKILWTNIGRGLEGHSPATAARVGGPARRVCVSAARARRPGGAWRSAAAGDTRAMDPGRAAASEEVLVVAIVLFGRG